MSEGKAEAEGVKGSIKELERLAKLQRESAGNERKSQLRLSKWTGKEHKARLRFLKEKERYERIEGELRNAENDYEERRDHAAGLTAQVAEKVSSDILFLFFILICIRPKNSMTCVVKRLQMT